MTKPFVRRHIAKAISYRILGTLQTLTISYLLTGSATIAGSAGIIELFIKPIMYYIHERVWYRFIRYDLTVRRDDT